MKLNLACGRYDEKHPFTDWVNLDIVIRRGYENFVCHDATTPMTMFEDETFDIVFSEHFLEHLDMNEAAILSVEVHRILKTGGVYRTVVPDAIFRKDEPPEKFPTHNNHKHKTAWTYFSLTWLLEQTNFTTQPVQHWNETGTQETDLPLLNLDLGSIRRKNSLVIDGHK